jgi:phosphonate metabolism-associated iron-containing alcohol dehydrogenase
LNSWQYHNPVAVTFGWGCLSKLSALLKGRRAVVVTFPQAQETGLLGTLKNSLGSQLAGVVDDVEPNPELSWVSRHYRDFWKSYSDCVVVAVGGGSVMDSAKMFLPGVASGEFQEIHAALSRSEVPVVQSALPMIAVPTTAGTGSEVTPWATLWDRTSARHQKYSLHLQQTWPEAALVDPALTLSLPHTVTRDSGLDALSHALEAIWNVNANPVSDGLAIMAARTVLHNLPALLDKPHSEELRTLASKASLLAGLAFSNTRTALAHNISYEMTLKHGLSHGLACSFTLPLVWRLAQGKHAERDTVLQQVFGSGVSDPASALEQFLNQVGVSTQFKDYGVSDDEAHALVQTSMQGPRGRNFIGSHANA